MDSQIESLHGLRMILNPKREDYNGLVYLTCSGAVPSLALRMTELRGGEGLLDPQSLREEGLREESPSRCLLDPANPANENPSHPPSAPNLNLYL